MVLLTSYYRNIKVIGIVLRVKTRVFINILTCTLKSSKAKLLIIHNYFLSLSISYLLAVPRLCSRKRYYLDTHYF